MLFWESGLVFNVLLIAGFLGVASLLRRAIKPLQTLAIPACIMAGVLGLALGPGGADAVSYDYGMLESMVYHGLAIIFIAIGLQKPAKGMRAGGAASMAFAIPTMAVFQGFIGLGTVLVMGYVAGEMMHPGIGLMLPLGFSQGPGQALSMGKAWEASGMEQGAQVGLIIAVLGYGWSILVGIPLVAWGRKKGLFKPPGERQDVQLDEDDEPLPPPTPGALEHVTIHLMMVGVIYLLAYGALELLASVLASKPQFAAMIWGFHFLFGLFLALGVRRFMNRFPDLTPKLDNRLLGNITGVTVDIITCAALMAVQIEVFKAHWLPIMIITTLGGGLTLVVLLWIVGRAFPEAPFEHCVLLFGMMTGTLPMGLALLRILDPELRGVAPINAILGSAGALVLGAPLLLVVLPMPVASWPDNYPSGGWLAIGVMTIYLALILFGWWKFGPLRMAKPLARLWVTLDEDAQNQRSA